MGKILRKHKHEFILAILVCIYISYFTIASFLRYNNFYTGRFDLGNMDQTVWNTINGRIFQTSSDSGAIISRLSSHADFMLILLSPLYLIWPHPKMLLLVQTFILALGAIFVFLIAKEVIKNKNIALIFGLLFLMNPLLQFTNLYDFHPVTLATTLLLASFYFLIKKKYFLLTIFLILSALTKEQVWVIVSFFGFALLFQKIKKINPAPFERCWIKLLGVVITFISLAIFGYLIWFAIPQTLGREHFALSYYSDFGNSPTQVIANILLSPQKLLSTVFEESRIQYLKQIFMPLGFLSFLSPMHLVFSVPDFFINLLSSNSQLHQIYYHYSATITPFIFISSIFGAKVFLKSYPKMQLHLGIYIVFFTFLSSYLYGPLPLAKKPNLDMFTKPQPNKEIIENFLSKIPQHYSVAATNNLGSHLSHREIIYTIPVGIDKADVVLFLDDHREIAENMRFDENYVEVVKIGNFIVFKKQGLLL